MRITTVQQGDGRDLLAALRRLDKAGLAYTVTVTYRPFSGADPATVTGAVYNAAGWAKETRHLTVEPWYGGGPDPCERPKTIRIRDIDSITIEAD